MPIEYVQNYFNAFTFIFKFGIHLKGGNYSRTYGTYLESLKSLHAP